MVLASIHHRDCLQDQRAMTVVTVYESSCLCLTKGSGHFPALWWRHRFSSIPDLGTSGN